MFFPRFIIKETLKERFVTIIRAKEEVALGVTFLFILELPEISDT